jgi:hypothetical protein
MVHVELTDVYRLKVTVLAVVFLMDRVRVDKLLVVTFPDFTTAPPSVNGRGVLVSSLDSCISTD